jgi:hypothetical protein
MKKHRILLKEDHQILLMVDQYNIFVQENIHINHTPISFF